MTSIGTSTGGPTPSMSGIDAQTQTDPAPRLPAPSDTVRANQIRQSYRPPHQLNSPDTTHAGSAALLAAQHSSTPPAWTYDGDANASAAASLARANSKPIEAWKPDKLSSAGAAASLAHRASISDRPVSRDASASASAALRPQSNLESHEPSQLAVSSAGASLTNSNTHAMRAASMAHKPSLSKSPEPAKTSPSHALRAASAADRDSGVARSPSLTYYRNPEDSARIQKLATELAMRDLAQGPPVGGVRRSDLSRVATISMAKKAETDKAEAEKAEAHKRLVQEEAMSEWSYSNDLDDAARRIVAERIARVTLTGDEGDEVLAGKAAGESIHRGDKRVKDWERVLKQMDDENKSDKEKNYGWLRHSMRKSAPAEPSRNDPALIMEAAKRNVKTRLDGMDKSIAQENLILGKPMGEHAVRREATTKELQDKGSADLQRVQKERASTYDIGGLIMTHEQVEAIAQKHVNEVLAEINEKVEREKERIEAERIEKETKARDKQHEKDLARERAAEEKAEKDRIKAEQRERKAEEKRVKEETKAAERKKKEDALAEQRAAVVTEKKKKDDEKKLKAVQAEQLAAAEGLQQYDKQKETEAEEAKEGALKEVTGEQGAAVEGVLEHDHDKEVEAEQTKEEALKEVTGEQGGAVEGVLQHDHDNDNEEARKEAVEATYTATKTTDKPIESPPADAKPDVDDDVKGGRIKSWFKSKVGRRLSRNAQDIGTSPSKSHGNAADEDIYGDTPKQPIIASNWTEGQIPADARISTEESVPRADSLKEVALAKDETSDSHEIEHVRASHETAADTVDEDDFVDAPEEIKETSSPYLGVEEDGRKVSSERGSRFKEEF